MIICPSCARDNEDHYKFCLGCGTELSKANAVPGPKPVPNAAPVKAMPVLVARVVPLATALPGTPALPVAAAVAVPVVTALPGLSVPGDAQPFDPTVDPAQAAITAEEALSDVEVPAGALPEHETGELPAMRAPATMPPVDPFAVEVPRVVVEEVPLPEDAPLHEEAPTDQVRAVDIDEIPLSTRPPLGRGGVDPTVIGDEPGFDVHVSLVAAAREAASRRCPSCDSAVPEGFKFCGVCGTRYEVAAAQTSPVMRARLVLIHPDGREGEAFDLPPGECTVGRAIGPPVFAEDPFLSPRHATFSSGPGRLTVRDEGSMNGIFLRLREEVELVHRDLFRVGQQLLRFEDMRHVRPVVPAATDGTLVFGSPARGCWGRLAALIAVETSAQVWTLVGPQVTLGRERGDIKFPLDGFVSGSHCIVSTRQGRFFLADQGSTNGTYLRVKGEQSLDEGDLLLLGQQLFRVAVGT